MHSKERFAVSVVPRAFRDLVPSLDGHVGTTCGLGWHRTDALKMEKDIRLLELFQGISGNRLMHSKRNLLYVPGYGSSH